MLSNILYVTVYVADQDRALQFYTEALGLEKQVDYAGPDGRFLTVKASRSPVEIILWQLPEAAGQPSGGPELVAPGPLILESDNLWKDFEVMRERGVTFIDPEPVDYPFGVRIEAMDPDGNRISLRQQRRGR
ncbi:VOC family protein [Nocardia sp. NPDC059228]|uniref:VOC family protein n=1 Tax=Nocardia sp. NPDC059228 TaxID=3346777 RepID=UPI0036BBD047